MIVAPAAIVTLESVGMIVVLAAIVAFRIVTYDCCAYYNCYT